MNSKFLVKKVDPRGVMPTKAHSTDAGFDVTVIYPTKRQGDVVWYGTGIAIEPPEGFYFHLYPRSSISKTGYMLANSIGIIDSEYQGEILVALRKMDPSSPELELPCKIGQLVPVRNYALNMEPQEVLEFAKETERGEGGFGSTDKPKTSKTPSSKTIVGI